MSKRELNLNYDSPSEIKKLLDIMGLAPRKRWGQNFLINRGAREKIVSLLKVESGNKVWEIGPGLGAMTKDLLDMDCDLTVFEIDPGYCEYLNAAFAKKGIKIENGDILKNWQDLFKRDGLPDRIMGNLPYNAASAIIGDLIENNSVPDRMVFTVQDEMGDRMHAKIGTKTYSSFSIMCQFGCKIIDGGKLTSGSFYPAPRVASRIVVLEPNEKYKDFKYRQIFFKITRSLFISRRKTIKNNILAAVNGAFSSLTSDQLIDMCKKSDIDITLRPERISIDQFANLSILIGETTSN